MAVQAVEKVRTEVGQAKVKFPEAVLKLLEDWESGKVLEEMEAKAQEQKTVKFAGAKLLGKDKDSQNEASLPDEPQATAVGNDREVKQQSSTGTAAGNAETTCVSRAGRMGKLLTKVS